MHGKTQTMAALRLYTKRPEIALTTPESIREVDRLLRKRHWVRSAPRRLREQLIRLEKALEVHAPNNLRDTLLAQALLLEHQATRRSHFRSDTGLWPALAASAESDPIYQRKLYSSLVRCHIVAEKQDSPQVIERAVSKMFQAHGVSGDPNATLLDLYRTHLEDRESFTILRRMVELIASLRQQLITEQSLPLIDSDQLHVVRWPCPDSALAAVIRFEQVVARPIYLRQVCDIPLRQVDWQILPPEEWKTEKVLARGRQRVQERKRESNDPAAPDREPFLRALENLQPIAVWEGKVFGNKGTDVYIAYEFPDKVAAEAVTGPYHNALYLAHKQPGDTEKGERYFPGKKVDVPSWHQVFGQDKATARALGAETHKHPDNKPGIDFYAVWLPKVKNWIFGE